MDETTFRILNTLWRHTGKALSINELTSKIRESYGTAHYPNIYHKLRTLAREEIITLTKAGKSSIANLNFGNYFLVDSLAEMELRKKRELLRKSKTLQILLVDIEHSLRLIPLIESMSVTNPEKNMRLNRAELLVLLHSAKKLNLSDEMVLVYKATQGLQNTHNIKLDSLVLTTDEFIPLMTSEEINPLKEMLPTKIAFYSPQMFWARIADALRLGKINLEASETNPARIAEKDLMYNLAKFGYKEIGSEISVGQNICIEYVIASILMRSDARRIESIPVILAKNMTNYRMLIFLSQKYGQSGRLLGLLNVLHKVKPMTEAQLAIHIMQALDVREIKANQRSIEERMKLYNAI